MATPSKPPGDGGLKEEPRRDFSVPIRVVVQRGDGTELEEFALNLSPYGICVHSREGWEVGEHVTLSFRLPPEGPDVHAGAHVVWSNQSEEETPGGASLWETGLHLTVDPELAAVLRAWASQPIDRRR